MQTKDYYKIKILTIVGARPQIIKAAAISRAIANKFYDKIEEAILHTGQHYDDNMSAAFFEELSIPKPNYNLQLNQKENNLQLDEIVLGIEKTIDSYKPNFILVYGDTNSTLAGALAANNKKINLIHVEAGLRSYNNNMPEEYNRKKTDELSTLLFCPTKTGVKNLITEGFKDNNQGPHSKTNPKIYYCGDVMYDNSLFFSKKLENDTQVLQNYNLSKNNFLVATLHRNYNTDNEENLNSIFEALNHISINENIQIILPLHPRTKKMLNEKLNPFLSKKILENKNFIITGPIGYLDMNVLQKNCKLILTDSGGLQKEAFFYKKPCIILRSETEWTEIVEANTAIIVGANQDKIIEAYSYFKNNNTLNYTSLFGDGKAAEFICEKIIENYAN